MSVEFRLIQTRATFVSTKIFSGIIMVMLLMANLVLTGHKIRLIMKMKKIATEQPKLD